MLYRFLATASLLTVLALSSGCSDSDRLAVIPVSGQVTLAGEPLKEAQVVFHPVDTTVRLPHLPLAESDEQGNYRLTTSEPFDGAPAGEYIVTVEQLELRQIGEEWVRAGRNLLPPRYSQPTSSPLRHIVSEATPKPAVFDLSK